MWQPACLIMLARQSQDETQTRPAERLTRVAQAIFQASSSPQSRATARLALVLDIDGTLIDSTDFDTVIHKRPGVDAFLDDCFSSFAAVAIWTHAGSDWARHVTQHVLTDADGRPRPWAFVWSASRASAKRKPIEHMFDLHPARDYIKPLLKVWRGKKRAAAGFTRDRTIIVEDTPSNCKSNYGNAVYVPTFQAGDWSDNTLPLLSLHLDELDAHVRAQGISVRYVEKRYGCVDPVIGIAWGGYRFVGASRSQSPEHTPYASIMPQCPEHASGASIYILFASSYSDPRLQRVTAVSNSASASYDSNPHQYEYLGVLWATVPMVG
ncbi:hypothetical protein EMIHUDRAFT_225968 [Emiliania huxleyi CCMP1516]|uniref:Mitochondrial import inner membrane translocase subunit TIM50 n=2 Tax=Emiliania huxleyi TaxID=2903 RepID=A0A0D3KML8_EMIH1|nr:hypothetical protein EMIHUDRAFT_225968 [Emiliania huxleyi CCMP1516]EOD37003.1 hypothetical protein EMIHUDRAFT_225968 [Emiliania huxleyi CCMP1516]|eukprot:XP_005789432.1 hypothetical protein EMIHUDRAFT_225968 [Emiliania huxleyi CCMP1516]